jgi:hypothetical protein
MTTIYKNFLITAVVLLIALCARSGNADWFDTTTQAMPHNFTHSETGFPLLGAHLAIECASCHLNSLFKGTPRNCAGCHFKGSRIVAPPKHDRHVLTAEPCEACHTNAVTFLGARINHGKVSVGSCTTCHNGYIATGKPANHRSGLQVTATCDQCHRTFAWSPSSFNHVAIAAGSCATRCHNGVSATGKPGSHTTTLKATSSCDTCHRFYAWLPTFYNHSAVAPGTCSTCHNSVIATGMTRSHTGLKGTMACDQCHITSAWSPARYNHLGVATGSCATQCHNGTSATGKPSSHTGSKGTLVCDSCHLTSAWSPAFYNHTGIARGTCLTCHIPDRPSLHVNRGYSSSCDNCHSIGSRWAFNHSLQQGQHTCNNCHSKHNNQTPCDYCHTVYSWGGH